MAPLTSHPTPRNTEGDSQKENEIRGRPSFLAFETQGHSQNPSGSRDDTRNRVIVARAGVRIRGDLRTSTQC